MLLYVTADPLVTDLFIHLCFNCSYDIQKMGETVLYLAEQERPVTEKCLHAGELLRSLVLKVNINQPTAGESLHSETVRNSRTVEGSHTWV